MGNESRKRKAAGEAGDGSGNSKKKIASAQLYAAVEGAYRQSAKELDAALETLLASRRRALAAFLAPPEGLIAIEGSVESDPSKRIDLMVVREANKAPRILLADHEKDVSLVRMDELLCRIKHEDPMARLRKAALDHVDAAL